MSPESCRGFPAGTKGPFVPAGDKEPLLGDLFSLETCLFCHEIKNDFYFVPRFAKAGRGTK